MLPAYNASKYISQAIESVLGQSYQDWELIIVDDCSNDGTYEIACGYKDRRISVYRFETNSGSAQKPRLFAEQHSEGDFIAKIDADDLWAPDFLEKLVSRQKQCNADIVYGISTYISDTGANLGITMPSKDFDLSLVRSGRDVCKMTIGGWWIAARGLVRKTVSDISKTDPMSDASISADEVKIRYELINSSKVAFCDAEYFYRINEESITKLFSLKRFSYLDNEKSIVEFAAEHYGYSDEVYDKAVLHYYFSLLESVDLLFSHKDDLNSQEFRQVKIHIKKHWRSIDRRVLRKTSFKIFLNYLMGPELFSLRHSVLNKER